ncbi:MAG: anaerobic ribonucleoside-triphosphate reductase activating protein [Candidatus Paceibacterota bacterium]|jgi:pyruvate formate lyase activating enzyme|nr:anaerobic ribonucleoside-triphosphate reductase activating protein [Candidatus Paceibacterota bacterium]
MMFFGGLQKTTLVDYPGKVAATLFTLGCNFRCPYCHNPELVLPELIKNQPKISQKDVLEFLEERKNLLEGICLTGGEPLIHKEIKDFIKTVKAMGYLIKLDTNGSFPDILENLIEEKLIDYVAMDIKGPKKKYEFFLFDSVPLANIEKSVKILKKGRVDYEFRTTLAPEILDEKDIIDLVNWIKPARRYFLQNFQAKKNVNPEFQKKKPWERERAEALIIKIKSSFNFCALR